MDETMRERQKQHSKQFRETLERVRGRWKGLRPPSTDEPTLDHCPECGLETHPGYAACWRCSTDVRERTD